MVRRLLAVMVLVLAAPSAAHAAELRVSDGVLEYIAAPGFVSNVTFEETGPGTVEVTRVTEDRDPITLGDDCTGSGPYMCTGVTKAMLDAGDMSDRLMATFKTLDDRTVGLTTIPVTLAGGDGNDALVGGARDDLIDGGAGNDDLDASVGDDTLRGGLGNDILQPNTGTDGISGGDGIDRVLYGDRTDPSYTLDGRDNDGNADEKDLIGADVEDIMSSPLTSTVSATIVGDGRANRLTVTNGRGTITGGEGSDVLEGGPRDDLINARDGSPDTVLCNGGTDSVVADTLDTISTTCENVSVQAAPGGPFDDRPPVIAWTSPAAGVSLSANSATTLAVNATDDRGLTRVQFFDDDRLVCDDPTAPYSCAYQPRGNDVGRNTLVAVATDGANQTASLVRAVTVRRFAPGQLELALRPSRDRSAPYAFRAAGRLLRPNTVSPSQGCSGTVTITAKRGTRAVGTQRAKLTRTCEYVATLRFRTRVGSRLRLVAKFGGNDVLSSRSSRSRTARLG